MSKHNFKDLTGKVFKNLTVIERAEDKIFKDNKIKVRWLCECVCGKLVVKYSQYLKDDNTLSCGCKTPKIASKYNLDGVSFGFLTVVSKSLIKNASRSFMWSCSCVCGNEVLVPTAVLINNHKKSCGCKTKAETAGTHGMTGTPTYVSWISMRDRCLNPQHKSYKYYKDITIDIRWVQSFDSFFADMGERPDGLTLDRIDSSLGYCKENCRWATNSEQQQNKAPNYINKHGGMAGVFSSGSRFVARIRYAGGREYLGMFDTAEDANIAYNKRGVELMGEEWVYKGAPQEVDRGQSK